MSTDKQKANLRPFQPGESGNPNGRPKGSKNRSTVVKELLEKRVFIPDEMLEVLRKVFPDIDSETTVEYLLTLSQISKAISKGDTFAYLALMDSAYGKAKNTVEEKAAMKIIVTRQDKLKPADDND